MHARIPILVLAGAAALAACAPKRIHEQPVLETGQRVPPAEAAAPAATERQAQEQARRDAIAAEAAARCAPAICGAIARGEVALGMSRIEVLAATRTTETAWAARDAGNAAILVPAFVTSPPHDALGELAMVQLMDGKVARYSYREAQGMRVVATPSDTGTAGRASARAEMLLREGDDLTARGDLKGALDRYDRAQVLRADDPLIDYRIATVLDKALRPIEALVRYQLFLHQMELENIEAAGAANARLAEAIAQARQRVIILEKQK